MLKVTIPAIEFYDEEINEFLSSKEQTIQLEHSLVSLSKWESKWNKPFLSKEAKSTKETIDYIRCMTITQNVDNFIYENLSESIVKEISEYIEKPMTATTFSALKHSPTREVITAELIYYWMITLNIPFECQKWHLNKLLTLINVCSIKNSPPKKMSSREIIDRNRALNELRKKNMDSRG